MAEKLIIIPGLGDRARSYRFFKPLWTMFGFETHIFVFGWNDGGQLTFDAALTRLVAYIDGLGGQCYIIGLSAGGTAAINALASRPKAVIKVATVCTPYASVPRSINKLLSQSVGHALANLKHMNHALKAKLLSTYGLYDQVVPIARSKPEGIKTKKLWAVWHSVIIFSALTIYSRTLRAFFKS